MTSAVQVKPRAERRSAARDGGFAFGPAAKREPELSPYALACAMLGRKLRSVGAWQEIVFSRGIEENLVLAKAAVAARAIEAAR